VILVYHQVSSFSFTTWQEHVTVRYDDNDACCVLDQYAESDFDSASSLKVTLTGRHISRL